jgi:tRNA (guanine37-N1)-methyltransferase
MKAPLRLTVLSGALEYIQGALQAGHLRIAQEQGAAQIEFVNLREFSTDSYQTIDDEPYGGGGGMVLKVEPAWRALKALGAVERIRNSDKMSPRPWVVLPTPKGRRLKQSDFVRLREKEHIIFLCSRYKGIDDRIRQWVDEEMSLGDYVIGGGEAAALVMIEGIVRLLSGVVGDRESVDTDSYTCGLLSAPVYTRPEEFKGERVPAVLLSGHHAEIRRWRRKKAIELTLARRPDLLAGVRLDEEDKKILSEVLGE